MADASTWKISSMDSWDWNVYEWTSLGLVKLAEAALLVPIWEYVVLVLVLSSIWLYRFLDFHFVDDLLHGFRGEVPRLHYNLSSKLATDILSKCKILKERYFSTPWLSSPHLQTAFLHFNGNPPIVKYHRQLFITPDNGTIALDWVKEPFLNGKGNDDTNAENVELDETPIVIIIPGLTSSSEDPYLKHMAYKSGMMGWRTLVSNHRGLGGIPITSDQFYNAGWTEDLRRIINYVHGKYPKAPIFTIGTSIGANVLVKYLGEEGDSTPVGAAAAVCNPWDLLVGDRFIHRKRVQRIYNKMLGFGLVQYATLHQTVLDRIADWGFISKSKTIRDFDHHCTRHVGKYETVDTYYRRASSADYLTKVTVPLLCFSVMDDPVCTREAIPWDEILANPNVVMVTTKHGGHLALFEGFRARTLWWTRALMEFMTLIIPSDLMRTSQKVSLHSMKSDSDVDKGPFLHVSSSGLVAAENLELSNSGPENSSNEREVHLEKDLPDQDASALKELEEEDGYGERAKVTLTFKDDAELLSLQSALLQLLQQLPSTTQQENPKNQTVKALRECTLATIEAPVSSAVTSPFKNFREAANKLALSSMSSGTSSHLVTTDKITAQVRGNQHKDASALKELEEEDGYGERAKVTLTFKDDAELLSLQSALLQLLQQLPSTTQQENPKNQTVKALRECTLATIEAPVSSAVTSPFKNFREAANKLALSSMSSGTSSHLVTTDKITAQVRGNQHKDASALKELEEEDGYGERAKVTLTFKDDAELLSLQSALLQLLQQLPSTTQQENPKNQTVKALRECTLATIEAPVSSAVTSPFKNFREAANKLALSSMSSGTSSHLVTTDKITAQVRGNQHKASSSNVTGISWLATQNRRTFWLLTYVALVTTCPWIGSLIFFWWRRKAFRLLT